jgi:hypothetical protein
MDKVGINTWYRENLLDQKDIGWSCLFAENDS